MKLPPSPHRHINPILLFSQPTPEGRGTQRPSSLGLDLELLTNLSNEPKHRHPLSRHHYQFYRHGIQYQRAELQDSSPHAPVPRLPNRPPNRQHPPMKPALIIVSAFLISAFALSSCD